MIILALLTLLSITNGSVMENIQGLVGEDVLLPCGCNAPDELIWQKGERIVNVYPKDQNIIDDSYVDRSHLFLNKKNTNCSLLLLNISWEDAGVYSCYTIISVGGKLWSANSSLVNLTVTAKIPVPEGQTIQSKIQDDSVTAASISIPILAMVVILAVVLLTLLIRKRHQTNTDTDLQAQQRMIQEV